MSKPTNQKAWFFVIPVVALVAFNALIPLMTVVNYSVQETFGNNVFFWEGVRWFEEVLNSSRFQGNYRGSGRHAGGAVRASRTHFCWPFHRLAGNEYFTLQIKRWCPIFCSQSITDRLFQITACGYHQCGSRGSPRVCAIRRGGFPCGNCQN